MARFSWYCRESSSMGGESPGPIVGNESAPLAELKTAGPPPAVLTPPATVRSPWLGRLFRSCLLMPAALYRNRRRVLAAAILLLLVGIGLSFFGIHLWAMYHFRAGRSALEQHHPHEALPHFQAALTVWSKDPHTLLLAARAARRLGIYDEAERYLETYRDACGSDDDLILEQVLLRAQRG